MLQLSDKLHAPIADLSGGADRKANLMSALLGSPEILILDEPTKGVDTQCRRQIWNYLRSNLG